MGAAAMRGGTEAWIRTHPDVAEICFGAAAAVALLIVSVWQWGVTEDGLARGGSIGLLLGAAVAYSYRRRRRREEHRENARLQQRLQLARDLHDTIAGQVAGIGIQAAAARRVLASEPEQASAALERIESASRAAVVDLRRMLIALRTDEGNPRAFSSSLSTPAASLQHLEDLAGPCRQAGLDVAVTVRGLRPASLPAAVDDGAYRIVQEALTNVLKHARGASVAIVVRYEPRSIGLSIANTAPPAGGDRPSDSGRRDGLGLVGIAERARLVGGTAHAGPTADGGWAVDATIPAG